MGTSPHVRIIVELRLLKNSLSVSLTREQLEKRATAEKDRCIVEMLVGLRRAISAAMLALSQNYHKNLSIVHSRPASAPS